MPVSAIYRQQNLPPDVDFQIHLFAAKGIKMIKTDLMSDLLEAIDNSNTDTFASFLADDVIFRFGNARPVFGKAAVKKAVAGFFASIKSLRHNVDDIWHIKDVIIGHGMVTYTRHNDTTLTVPFANIFKMDGDMIKDYLIFADTSELYK